MARARNIKPQFYLNEHLAQKSPYARLLFIGLWCLADCKGRMEDRPMRIKAALFPYEQVDIDALLNELAEGPEHFIIRYQAQGNSYIEITNFSKHQNPVKKEREAGSRIPPCPVTVPNEFGSGTVPEPNRDQAGSADILIPDILKTETGSSDFSGLGCVSDENLKFAQAGLDYLLSLSHPNFSSPLWVKGYLSLQFQELEQTHPAIPKPEILRLWRDTCDLATQQNKPGPQWSKSTFKNKLDAWTPEQVKTPLPDPASGERGAKAKALLEFPFILNTAVNEVHSSDELEWLEDSPNGLFHKGSYFPIMFLEGLTELPA